MNATTETTAQTADNLTQPLTIGIMAGMDETLKKSRRAKGTGCLIYKGVGKPYLAKWTVGGKPMYQSTGESNYRRAEAKLREFTAGTERGTVEDQISLLKAQLAILESKRKLPEIAIAEIWNEYEKTLWQANLAEGTISGYRTAVRALEDWMKRQGCRYMGDIDTGKAEIYLRTLQKELGKVSYNNRLVLFKKVWRVIAKAGKWNVQAEAFEAFEKIKGVKHESKRRALTGAEVKALLEKADADMKQLITICLYTGLRIGDACTLKWADVNMDKDEISVIPEKTKKHGTRVTIPLASALRAELEKADMGGEYVNARHARIYESGHIQEKMKKLFESCGIETSETDKDGKRHVLTGAHAFRHTFISWAINSGMSPMLVKQIVGHSALEMTEHYFHANAEAMREGIENLAKVA